MSTRGSYDTIAMQKLAIRLFFSESLQRRWRADPESVVDDFGVPRDWIRYLPTVETPQFKAEVWGRRLLIGREIHGRFGKALRWMTGETDAIAFARGELLARFLDSEEFFSPHSAIPHPYGMGPGYENVTKFFVWLVADQALARPFEIGKRRRLLAMRRRFYAAYGVHLVTQAQHSTSAFYGALRAGVYFSSLPAGKLAWEMVDAELGVTRLNGLAEPILKESGLVDIDFLLTLNNTQSASKPKE